MKKIISLVVMATMLCTLFAVNVSAGVPVGDVAVPDIVDVSFTTNKVGYNGWKQDGGFGPKSGTGNRCTPTLLEDGTILSLKPVNDSRNTPHIVGVEGFYFPGEDTANDICLPENYELSFRAMNVSDTRLGFIVWLNDDRIGGDGAYLAFGSAESTSTPNKWFEYKITVKKGVVNVIRRNITDDGEWTVCQKYNNFDGENGAYRTLTNWSANGVNGFGFGFGAQNWIESEYGPGWSDSFEYHFSDVSLKTVKSTPADGVYLAQDYEGVSTALTSTSDSEGKIEMGKENGNHFAKLISNNKYGGFITGIVAPTNTWSDISYNNITLTFDAAWKKDVGTLSILVGKNVDNNQIAGTLNLNIPANEADKDKWYTYKVVGSGTGDSSTGWRNAVVYRKEKGSSAWTKFENFTTATYTDAAASAGTVFIGSYNTKGGVIAAETEYWIDNITIAKRESYSLPSVEVADGNLKVTVAYENGGEMALGSMAPVLATFDTDNNLVGVDFATPTAEAGQVEAELSATATGAVKAEIYIWDGIGTVKPIKSSAIPLTSYLAQ